ncbi:MAG: hypothetical protein IJD91_06805 [Clostridia bacterium]|nr:hypothetical protein [Clostridia bacterium]
MDIREFKNTYSKYSPSVIWDWCAKPTAEEIDTRLCEFSDMGISHVYIRVSKGLVLPYLSNDYFELIRTAARRSGKYGIALFICDENSSSSGNGGGEITSVSDYRVRDFVLVEKKDTEKFDEVVEDKASHLYVLRDMSKMRATSRSPLADISNPFVTECFIDSIYSKYIRECKRFLGHEIKGFSTSIDIPQTALPYYPLALSRCGETLPGGAEKLLTEESSFIQNYYTCASDCISENFSGILHKKCEENNLLLSVNVNGKKEISRQKQYLCADTVSVCFDSQNPDFTELKLAHTVAEQFGKGFVIRLILPKLAPSSARYNNGVFMASFGADSIVYDSVAFSLSDRRKYEANTISLSKYTEKNLSERLSRLCFAASNIKSDAGILLVYDVLNKESFDITVKELLVRGISFHIVEKSFFVSMAQNCVSSIKIGSYEYETLIVSDKESLGAFNGNIISVFEDIDYDALKDKKSFDIICNKSCYINRYKDCDDEYIFVTAQNENTYISAEKSAKELFIADSSSGEIYKVPVKDKKAGFTLKAGKTALIIASGNMDADIAPPYTDDIEFAPCKDEGDVLFALSGAEENIFPLKNVNACFGRKSFRESSIDNLHKEFYALADGETVKVKYPFHADKNVIGEVRAYIENADNLDFIELNGKRLEGFTPSSKDPRFMGVDITNNIADGKNTFALEYKKSNNYTPTFGSLVPSHFYSYNVTSFEPVYLCGDFDEKDGVLTRLDEYENDITKSGMGHYYGPVTYAVKLPESNLSGKAISVHGDFDICRIKIGKRTLTFFSENPMIEVFNLDCGVVAEITIYNTPYNLLRSADEKSRAFGIEKIKLCSFEY